MKKLLLLCWMIIMPVCGCTINYETYKASLILKQNSDGTYTRRFNSATCDSTVEVYYLDLKNKNGETIIGDSTYIKCGDVDIIIDAGEKNPGSYTVVPFLKEKVTDRKIELVIATHTDLDHIGGFVGMSTKEGVLSIEGFTYEHILESGHVADTIVYRDFMADAAATNAKMCTANEIMNGTNQCAKIYRFGNATLEVLDTSFYNDGTASPNNRSIVTMLTHNDVTFLFPGDLEDDEFFAANSATNIDIFKASHHGASSANSTDILTSTAPEVIILSTSGDNSYNIPQQESLDRMYPVTETIYATFTTGTIKITSDGTNYEISADNLVLFHETEWFIENRTKN